MTAKLIPLHGDEHRDTQELLPWYTTGQLEPADREKVEAHLAGCPACRAEFLVERRLGSEVAALPLELELGWLELRGRLYLRPGRWAQFRDRIADLWNGLGAGEHAGWVAAAQFSLLLVAVAITSSPEITANRAAEYHALGRPGLAGDGNVLAMFRPGTEAAQIRQVLARSNARLVEGPTPAGAYLLSVDPAARNTVLARLRSEPAILLAEPLDQGSSE